MNKSSQSDRYLEHCRQLIENQLQWANSDLWRHQEFLTLSEKILDKTGVALSVNTLKRLWGKVAYEHNPNATTLDALAKFVGYENWMKFIADHSGPDQNPPEPIALKHDTDPKPKVQVGTILLESFFTIGMLGLILSISYDWWRLPVVKADVKALEKVVFSSDKVVEGLPNTVVFNYDISMVSAERYFIQQNWDNRRRMEIDPAKTEATSVYYYPGYWRAKILADTMILREHDLLINSNGWLLTLDSEPKPRYFLPEDRADGSALSVDENIFREAIQGLKELPWFTAHYVEDFGQLEMDNLRLEFTIKNDYRSGITPCQDMQIVVLGSEGIFSIPLCNRGCIGDIRLRFNDLLKEGTDHNLSAFGRDMNQWQHLEISVVDKEVHIYLDEVLVESLTYVESAGLFYGVRIKSKGLGKIGSVRIGSSVDSGNMMDLFPSESR